MPISYPPMSFAGLHRYYSRNLFLCCNMKVLCQSSASRLSKTAAPRIISKSDRSKGGHIYFRHTLLHSSITCHHQGGVTYSEPCSRLRRTYGQNYSLRPLRCSNLSGTLSRMGISSMQRSTHTLDAPHKNLGVCTLRKHCLSILMCWQRHAITSGLVCLSFFFEGPLFTIPTAFELSDGIETTLGAEPPSGVDATFDLEDHDPDSDYDPFEEAPYETATQSSPDKIVKAYVVKYTAYRTYVCGLRSLMCPLMKS